MQYLLLAGLLLIALIALGMRYEAKLTPEQRAKLDADLADQQRGPIREALICPHCQAKGVVRSKQVRLKKGVSGAKATGALITGGLSVLVTGLSRKETATQAHCTNCGTTWHIS